LNAWQAGADSILQGYATLLQRHYLDGMSWEETADELGVSNSTFFRERDAALERLREELE